MMDCPFGVKECTESYCAAWNHDTDFCVFAECAKVLMEFLVDAVKAHEGHKEANFPQGAPPPEIIT